MAGKDLQLVSGPPPVGGGPGTLGPQQRRTVRATALVPSAASPVKGAHQLSAGYGGDHNVQAKLVQNLQQQVFFLELELKYLREQRGSTLSGAKPTEGRPDAAAQEQGREQTSALREAMLRAEFRKEQAQADKAKAIGELGRLRDKFTAQLQELTAEVVGLQSALEQRNQAEKMLRMDLAETTNKYEERKAFTEGYDTRVKLLEVKIDELSAEVQRARVREQELRKELLEAQQTSQAFESKAAAQAATARHTAAQRREALGEAEAAAVRLREEEMKLERELQARRQADEQAAFLVRENAKLKTALAELSISAERLASDNATAQQDNDNNKMVKVLSRWMIRKMRDKLTVTLEEMRNQEVGIHDLHEKLVKANRRCDAATDQLRQELQRTALREEYYNQQGDDAAKLIAENRLLIGRVEEMGSAMEQHKLELERLQQENASLNAKTQLMEERSVLLKKIRQRESHALQLLDQAKAELDESEIFA